jgi:hypothetical protein
VALAHRDPDEPGLQPVNVPERMQLLEAIEPNGLKDLHCILAL